MSFQSAAWLGVLLNGHLMLLLHLVWITAFRYKVMPKVLVGTHSTKG